MLLLWKIKPSKCVLLDFDHVTLVCLFLLDFTWKVSLSSLTMTPTVWGSNCTSSPHSCWPPASTPEAVSEHSCKSRGKTFNWTKKRHHISQRTHNIDYCILCFFLNGLFHSLLAKPTSCMVRSENRMTKFSSTRTMRPVSPSKRPAITFTWSPIRKYFLNSWAGNSRGS